MAKPTTLQDKVAQNSKLMSGQKTEPVQKLAAQQGLAATPLTAYGTTLMGGTDQQAKMAGTPAQKAASIAQSLPTETALSQAQLLRAPAEASTKDIADKEQAARLATSLGTFGAKVTGMIQTAMANVVGKKDEVDPAKVELKLNTAATRLKGLTGPALETVQSLITSIATETDPAKKNELTNSLNSALGLTTIDTQLQAAEVPGLISSLPETVAGTAQAAVRKTLGPDQKLTIEDVGQLGTSYGELAGMLGVTEDEVKNFTIGQLQERLAAVSGQITAPVQAVQAGMSSGLLSEAERASLRQSLTAMQETGRAGAAMQLSSLVEDIDAGTQVKVGNTMYTADELLGSEAMTEIVKRVLEDPEGKVNPFVASLKKDEPDLYRWIVGSKDSLQQLVTGAQTGVTEFQSLQEKNRKLLEPLKGQESFFKDLGWDINKLSAKEIKPGDLPASAQYVLAQPPGAQNATAARLAELGVNNVKDLTTDQIKNLQPENPDGPAAQWLAAKKEADNAAKLSSPKDILSKYTNTEIDLSNIDDLVTTSNLANALGFDGGNVAELDVAPPYGKIDENDAKVIQERMTQLPPLKDIASGTAVPPKATFQLKTPTPPSPENQEVLDTMKRVFADGFFTQEEADALPWSVEKMQGVLNNLPRPNGRYVGQGVYIANTLQNAIERKQKARQEAETAAESERLRQETEAARAQEEKDKSDLAQKKARRQALRSVTRR